MIEGKSITYLQKNDSTIICDDFCFKNGVHYLPYYQKNVFYILSINSVSLKTGSLAINGVELLPTGFSSGSGTTINLDVKNTGALLLVSFYKKDEGGAKNSCQKLVSDLQTLKSSVDTEEKKKDKIAKLKTVLLTNNVSYFLMDFNNPLNYKNRLLWETVFSDYEGCGFFLSKNIEESKAALKTKPDYRQPTFLSYRIPLAIISFLTAFLYCCARSFQMKTSSRWITFLVMALLLLAISVVITTVFSKRKIKKGLEIEKLFSFELYNCLANLIGFIVTPLAVWVLSKKTAIFADGIFEGAGLATITLLGCVLLFAPTIVGHVVYKTKNKSVAHQSGQQRP